MSDNTRRPPVTPPAMPPVLRFEDDRDEEEVLLGEVLVAYGSLDPGV